MIYMVTLFARVYQNVMRVFSYLLNFREPKLIKGDSSLIEIYEIILKEKKTKPLIFTDEVLLNLHIFDQLFEILDKKKVPYVVFSKIKPNPTIDVVEEAFSLYKSASCDMLIALGGGSVMDTAKACGARVAKPNKPISKMKGVLKVNAKLPLLVAVPTTAGTGSECTIAAVISDSKNHTKYAINDPSLIPNYAILDPSLTIKLPQKTTSTTGMDALTHAVEAYIGHANTKRTKDRAIKAIKLINENLLECYETPNNITARMNMQVASYYAGIAFTRAYVGYVHALAHALGGLYNTPHGLANAVLLPYVLEAYGKKAHKKLAELYDVVFKTNSSLSIDTKANLFISWIKDLNSKMGIPKYFAELKKEDIPSLAKHAYKEGVPLYPTPKIFKLKDFEDIYLKVCTKD